MMVTTIAILIGKRLVYKEKRLEVEFGELFLYSEFTDRFDLRFSSPFIPSIHEG